MNVGSGDKTSGSVLLNRKLTSYIMSPIAFIILLIVAVSGSLAHQLEICSSDSYRLPKHIIPTHYDLTVDVDLAKDTFNGQVDIHVNVEKISEQLGQNQIALHASHKLLIEKVEYVTPGSSIEVLDICRNKNDVVIITLAHDLVVGSEGVLHISFVGEYGKTRGGFYKSKETSSTSISYDIAMTQFEPIDARSAFPCFDEPAFKATYSVNIIHSKHQTALSNTKKLSEEVIEGAQDERVKSIFAKTPRMSSYLVAFVVGRLDYIEQVILDGRVTLRFYTPEGRAEESRHSLAIAAKALPLLEEYFGIDFPLRKIDFVSVNEMYESGMENWGLITMPENLVLDTSGSMYFSGINAAQIVVHQLAHQWFGNLVTMEWWNDVWLNDALANWVEYHLTAELMPDIDFNAVLVVDSINPVFRGDFDGKEGPVASRTEDENISRGTISQIVSTKGSAIIENVQQQNIKPDNFRSALRHYLEAHAYGNVRAQDLFDSLKLYSEKPVPEKLDSYMESWLYQDGHPILSVNVEEGFLKIEQSVFTHDKTRVYNGDKRWVIPVDILFSDSEGRKEVKSLMLSDKHEGKKEMLPSWFDPKNSHHWLKLNYNVTGLYNVEYSPDLLLRLKRPIKKKLMNPLDRLELLNNYASILAAGVYKQPVKLEKFIKWYANEDNYAVTGGILVAFNEYLNSNGNQVGEILFDILANYLKEDGYQRGVYANAYSQLIQSQILVRAISYKYKPIIKSLFAMLDQSKSINAIQEPYRTNLIRSVLSHGSSEQVEQLKAMVNNMDDSVLKERYLESIKTKKPNSHHKLSKFFKFH